MTIRIAIALFGVFCAAPWAHGRMRTPRAFAWLGSWQEMRAPSLDAPEAGTTDGRLGEVFEVAWIREGRRLTATFLTLNDGWCGRLGVEVPFGAAVETVEIGYNDLPVAVPLQGVKAGQIWWTWGVGVPRWALGGSDAVLLRTHEHHGCFLINRDEGPVVQLCVDRPPVGESASISFDLVENATADTLRAAARTELAIADDPPIDAEAAERLRDEGFVRADSRGFAFETADGRPYYPLGRNLPHLPTLAPAEQEALLDEVVAARMNTIRILLPDYTYRPVPGGWNEGALKGLTECLRRCASRGVRVIVCLEYSGAGHQYSNTIHLSSVAGDLYVLADTLQWYADMAERVVKPLRNDPAILAWNVTNEPFIEPDARSKPIADGFGKPLPSKDEYEKQSTPEAREFFRYAQGLLADSMVRRGRLVREADPDHLISVSAGYPRLLRGHEGADLFDFWAPHTYDLWVNGPAIDHHCALLLHTLRWALPDRPRPVVIEEYGIAERPQYADEMRTEHIAQFLQGGTRHGLAGLLHWWEMSPAMSRAYAATQPYAIESPEAGRPLAVYLPPSQEWRLVFYSEYMTRRAWGEALVKVTEAGWTPRVIGAMEDVGDAEAVLVLGDSLTEDEVRAVEGLQAPVYVLEGSLKGPVDGAKGFEDLPR